MRGAGGGRATGTGLGVRAERVHDTDGREPLFSGGSGGGVDLIHGVAGILRAVAAAAAEDYTGALRGHGGAGEGFNVDCCCCGAAAD